MTRQHLKIRLCEPVTAQQAHRTVRQLVAKLHVNLRIQCFKGLAVVNQYECAADCLHIDDQNTETQQKADKEPEQEIQING